MTPPVPAYRGRLAPSPTGYLHLGHARTFWIAQERARLGTLVLRNEDLDGDRRQPQFVRAMFEDLHWFGLRWQEGPDCGGPFAPYTQSERRAFYVDAFHRLLERGYLYPCQCSRRDVQLALGAPHAGEEEPVYPGTCRPRAGFGFRVPSFELWTPDISSGFRISGSESGVRSEFRVPGFGLVDDVSNSKPETRNPKLGSIAPKPETQNSKLRINWRFRVPDGEVITFLDRGQGPQSFVAGSDFGDFVVWRHDDSPAYQLAVTVDDAAMQITEVVRGNDLLMSTARQLLLYRALGLRPPEFFHCPLLTDDRGVRLAKRHDALSLRALRERGATPEELRAAPGFGMTNP